MTAANFILVADDDEPSREGLKLLLSRWGYAAETAVDGADALYHAVTRHPALIITDLHMPKMDGLELLRTVQVSLPDVPTIIVTGTDEGIRSRADAAQMAFGYLRKPVDVTCLKGLVQSCDRDRVAHGRLSLAGELEPSGKSPISRVIARHSCACGSA